MNIKLCAYVDGMYVKSSACMKIPELYEMCYEPLKSCDDPIVAFATGETISNAEIQRVMKLRKDAANVLAEALAEMIVSDMEKQDTHNGYPKFDN